MLRFIKQTWRRSVYPLKVLQVSDFINPQCDVTNFKAFLLIGMSFPVSCLLAKVWGGMWRSAGDEIPCHPNILRHLVLNGIYFFLDHLIFSQFSVCITSSFNSSNTLYFVLRLSPYDAFDIYVTLSSLHIDHSSHHLHVSSLYHFEFQHTILYH